MRSDVTDFDVELLKETEKAWLFDFGLDEVWVPKSVGEFDEQSGTVALPGWFVERHDIA